MQVTSHSPTRLTLSSGLMLLSIVFLLPIAISAWFCISSAPTVASSPAWDTALPLLFVGSAGGIALLGVLINTTKTCTLDKDANSLLLVKKSLLRPRVKQEYSLQDITSIVLERDSYGSFVLGARLQSGAIALVGTLGTRSQEEKAFETAQLVSAFLDAPLDVNLEGQAQIQEQRETGWRLFFALNFGLGAVWALGSLGLPWPVIAAGAIPYSIVWYLKPFSKVAIGLLIATAVVCAIIPDFVASSYAPRKTGLEQAAERLGFESSLQGITDYIETSLEPGMSQETVEQILGAIGELEMSSRSVQLVPGREEAQEELVFLELELTDEILIFWQEPGMSLYMWVYYTTEGEFLRIEIKEKVD